MCGITGFLDYSRQSDQYQMKAAIDAMTLVISHRGPDHHGVWVDPEKGIALGHRRLAVIDLSKEGNQPMQSNCGRYWIVYNGEIYNYLEVKNNLEHMGYVFRGTSDTEVMLAAISQCGLRKALESFNGMFAFALWDIKENKLWLARDRFGEKPLFYGWCGKSFFFGSELKALKKFPEFQRFHGEINQNALASYLRFNYIPYPYSIYKGIFKLPPSTYLEITKSDCPESGHPISYWSTEEIFENGLKESLGGTESEILEQVEALMTDSVRLRMNSDVPLGAFLSGGLDSSTVVALMQSQSSKKIRTFTIGFHESQFNEAEFAKRVADRLCTDHTELYVDAKTTLDVIPLLSSLYDEPFADSSQIPTYLVSKLARKSVTVTLSGDGGDELFGGYNRYLYGVKLWNQLNRIPRMASLATSRLLTLLSPETWDNIFHSTQHLLPRRMRYSMPGYKIHKLADALRATNQKDLYIGLASTWKNPNKAVLGARELLSPIFHSPVWQTNHHFEDKMMYLDMITYLSDDILTKVDRAAMGVSLESRIPFLDHRLAELSWKLPIKFKIRDRKGKWILRKILSRFLPDSLIERPKMGFGIPLGQWLRGPLKSWAGDLLEERRLKSEGYFNVTEIRNKWHEHLSGQKDWQYDLWSVLMFQAWCEK